MPGHGGVTRGRADAEMIWGEETPEGAARFQAERLDPATALDPESTGVVGVAATTPETAPVREGAGDAAVDPSAGRGAWRRRLAPRHRGAVRSFFATEDE